MRSRRNSTRVVIVGPRLDARGGIAMVNATYAAAGLFEIADDKPVIRYFPSTRDGSALSKLAYGGWRLAIFTLTHLPRPSVVHLHTTGHTSFWRKAAYAWVARAKAARVIHHIHAFAFFDFYERGGRLRRTAVRETLRRADALIALTEGMATRLRAIAPSQQIEVLPNPIQLGALRLKALPLRNPHLVLFLGWFIPEKGIYDLLDAIPHAVRHVPNLRLALGGFRNESAIQAHVRDLGIEDRVELLGWLDRDGVRRALGECAVLALPSQTEGFPLVLVEAMACGTPIVTCPVGGIPEILRSPRNALFVSPGDVTGLSTALVELLTTPHLREAMSAAGPEDAKRFDASHVITRLRAIYEHLLDSSHKK